MLQNIREIGIFMILAQALVHFAPGKQYGKYIKSISGVIILLLFLKPFVQLAGGEWQSPIDKVKEGVKLPEFSALQQGSGLEDAVKRRMEGEIETMLNRELAEDPCLVRKVELSLSEGAELSGEEPFYTVEVVIGDRKAQNGEIAVEEITVGAGQEREEDVSEAYRLRFAEVMKMEKERVEVRWDGRD